MERRRIMAIAHGWIPLTACLALLLSGSSFGQEKNLVATTKDGKLRATAMDKVIVLTETAAKKELRKMHGHTARVAVLVFAPDGMKLASGGHDNTVRIWETASGRELLTLRGHTFRIESLKFSPDGKTLTSTDSAKKTRKWDVTTGRSLP